MERNYGRSGRMRGVGCIRLKGIRVDWNWPAFQPIPGNSLGSARSYTTKISSRRGHMDTRWADWCLNSRLVNVQWLGSGGVSGRIQGDFLDGGLGLPQQFLAAALERLAALVDRYRLFEGHFALLEPFDDRFQLFDGPLERQLFDVGVGGLGHGRSFGSV